ncbi:hypothetical protein AVEN_9356-1 [Araneus ventricosus]|uniref:Uncharacterized protein n=1 Tax=Araneus ventricosus TaxID=182803 RepID=A0A4Y2DKM8_ARAVE|nr:hypothetical protein AVEN_9356-1 [Araneus ventricosus]
MFASAEGLFYSPRTVKVQLAVSQKLSAYRRIQRFAIVVGRHLSWYPLQASTPSGGVACNGCHTQWILWRIGFRACSPPAPKLKPYRYCAANWAASKNVSINTDSLSSIAAIKSASARSSFVNNIKQDLVKIKHLVGLSWVKAHVGIQRNELADQQAKLATTTGVDTIIPAPRSYVKRLLNKLMIKEWNDYWRHYNSTSGARVREYLEHDGIKKLGVERLNIYSFGSKTPKKQTCRKVEVRLRNVLSGEETVIEAVEIEEISRATLSLPNQDAWREMESRGFRLTFSCSESSESCEISLLIGSDFYWSLTNQIKRLDSSLVAVETSLGWSLESKCDERSDCITVNLIHSEEESISAELRRFWEIESLGIRDKDSVTLGNGDEEILSEFDKSISFVDGRYRVSLLWKQGMRKALLNNKTVARKLFEGLVPRFKCDHELFCEYKDVINDYVREGIVERTSCDSLSNSQGFYLPHHAMVRSNKTTSRLRIVFDGSAHEDGHSSLNQSLYTGPNLHPNIFELLLHFRENPVAFTADVKSAFLQIELDLPDRDFTRFFWTDNLNNEPYVLNFTRVLWN